MFCQSRRDYSQLVRGRFAVVRGATLVSTGGGIVAGAAAALPMTTVSEPKSIRVCPPSAAAPLASLPGLPGPPGAAKVYMCGAAFASCGPASRHQKSENSGAQASTVSGRTLSGALPHTEWGRGPGRLSPWPQCGSQ